MLNVYVAGWMDAKLKNPELLETVSRFAVVASLVSTTLALGITAPLESATVPLIEPAANWPKLGADSSNAASKLRNRADFMEALGVRTCNIAVPLKDKLGNPTREAKQIDSSGFILVCKGACGYASGPHR